VAVSRPHILDTNAVSSLIQGRAAQLDALLRGRNLCLSVISEAELRYGLARRPQATRLAQAVESLLAACTILPWTPVTSRSYGTLRAQLEASGVALSAMDLLIAAHASEHDAVIVSADQVFTRVPGLTVLNWTLPP